MTEAIRDQVRAEMARKGWSQAALAREAGATQSQISRWLSGEKDVHLATLASVAAALGLEVTLRRPRP